MPNLIYLTNVSLDGYIEDASGRFDWSVPDEELHQFFNDLTRPIGTFLYGRRLYDSMAVWETDPGFAADNPITAEFAALWQAADKVVYSTTLDAPRTTRTRLERTFDPAAVRGQADHAEPVGVSDDHIHGLDADRPGSAEQDDITPPKGMKPSAI